jgi:histone deacetylase complex regulatory component SIN3
MKVRNRLEQSNPVAFKEFFTTLGQCQSTSGSFLELYRKIENILKDNMDLLEEFVLFLSPEAAAQCGVQFQHFLYVRMREFFSKLKVNFVLGH